MTPTLAGLTVVVTRPAHQAGRFLALLRDAGAEPILLPAIEIERIELDATTRERMRPDDFDWTIYTSANAVDCSLDQLARPSRTRIGAIGRATARALEERGLRVAALPAGPSESEGLLALEAFADLRGRRVLVLKGAGGRTLLREELARRGAEVVPCDVYRRRPAAADPAALDALSRCRDVSRVVVAATSSEVLAAVLAVAPETAVPHLRDSTLLVPGERVAAAARKTGWRGPLLVADSAEDAAMFDALARRPPGGGPSRLA